MGSPFRKKPGALGFCGLRTIFPSSKILIFPFCRIFVDIKSSRNAVHAWEKGKIFIVVRGILCAKIHRTLTVPWKIFLLVQTSAKGQREKEERSCHYSAHVSKLTRGVPKRQLNEETSH